MGGRGEGGGIRKEKDGITTLGEEGEGNGQTPVSAVGCDHGGARMGAAGELQEAQPGRRLGGVGGGGEKLRPWHWRDWTRI